VPAQVRHVIDRANRIALDQRTVTCVIVPNDVQELDAVVEANPINPQRVFWELSPRLPDHSILTCDAGTSATWYARDLKVLPGMMGSLSGGLASMGSAVPYAIAAKFVQGTQHVRQLTIGGKPALWIEGAPHEFLFVGPKGEVASAPLRLDKNTLLWQQGRVLLRLEGDLTLAQALRVARSLR